MVGEARRTKAKKGESFNEKLKVQLLEIEVRGRLFTMDAGL